MILCNVYLCNDRVIIFISVQIWFWDEQDSYQFPSMPRIYFIPSPAGDFTPQILVLFYCLLFLYTL